MPKLLKKLLKAPNAAIEKTFAVSKKISKKISRQHQLRQAEGYWKTLGPGLTTGAADDDPSGIATYSQTGAKYGFQLLWLAPFTFPLMSIVQEMCARIGLVTGRGLAANIRLHYPKRILYLVAFLLFAANSFNIGVDLGAMAKATQLLTPGLDYGLLLVIFTCFSLVLEIFIPYRKYAKYLKWLAMVLLSYLFSALLLDLNWGELLRHSLIPSLTFSKEQIFLLCGILGTTISPYLFFWETSQEVEEEILAGKTTVKKRQTATNKEIKKMRIDNWSGMFVSNLIMFFIIAASAATLYQHGITNITTAADAALALRPLAGQGAFLLFAIGIIGSGLLAIPVLAGSASYAIAESFGWHFGLYRKLRRAYGFYAIIVLSMLLGLMVNFFNIDPIRALIYAAVANGLIAPVILALIVKISSNEKIMGHQKNHPIRKFFGWFITFIMAIAGIATIAGLIF